jgi:hypothetical protein
MGTVTKMRRSRILHYVDGTRSLGLSQKNKSCMWNTTRWHTRILIRQIIGVIDREMTILVSAGPEPIYKEEQPLQRPSVIGHL